MRIRYFSYIALAAMAAGLIVATTVFSLSTVATLALGIGVLMLIVSLSIMARAIAGDLPSHFIGAASALLSVWIIVSSQVFSLSTVSDVTFYSAIGAGILAVIGLTAHELRTERVVHSLELRSRERQPEPADGSRPLAA